MLSPLFFFGGPTSRPHPIARAPAERLLQQLCEFVPYTTAICGVDDAARTDYLGSLTAGRLGAIDEMEQSGPTRRAVAWA